MKLVNHGGTSIFTEMHLLSPTFLIHPGVKKFKCIWRRLNPIGHFSITQAWGTYFTECSVKKIKCIRRGLNRIGIGFSVVPKPTFLNRSGPSIFTECLVKKFIKCIPVGVYGVGAQTRVPVLINIFTECSVKKFKCIYVFLNHDHPGLGYIFYRVLGKKSTGWTKLELDFLLPPSRHFSIARVPVFFTECSVKPGVYIYVYGV